jgi:glycosyltransferase involved in cell wall biosynthesis
VRVLAFGTYQRDYPRFTQAAAAMRAGGIEVVERHRPVWEGRSDGWQAGPLSLARLALAEAALATHPVREHADAVYVGYPGHLDLAAARRVARGRPVVFDPLVSLYDTLVSDRGRFRAGSPAARVLRRVDRRAFRSADLVVADTEAHADFFSSAFAVPRERLAVCPVGADDELFTPGERPEPVCDALFVGKLIPLHGVEAILVAASRAPELRFRIVGDGQLSQLLAARPPNVTWVPWVPYEQLPQEYRSAACALGVFGTSAKAGRVVPNKAYQALATATALVTADTPAARELLTADADALLVRPGDPDGLAAAIRRLVADDATRAKLGAAGRATYEARASLPVLAARWRSLLEELVAGR